MLKKLMAVSVIAAIPAASFAGGPTVGGFADITYTQDNKLFAANAELDVSNSLSKQVTVRVDTDLALAVNGGGNASAITGGPADSAVIEQAFFAYTPIKAITVIGGVFNNPIGWEKEDAPDMYSISKGQIYGILDGQTALYGNNLAGAAIAGAVGPATITVAALNDLGQVTDKNSIAAVANVTPVKGLDLELGYVTQDAGAGNVWDVNATYSGMGATVGLEVLGAENAVDLAWGALVNYEINPMFNVTARYDSVSYEAAGTDDSTSYALVGTFNAAKNLAILAEFQNVDKGNAGGSDDTATLEFIASF